MERFRAGALPLQKYPGIYPGQFGQIVAVRLRSSNRKGKEYAMKIVEKAKIKEENLLQSSYL